MGCSRRCRRIASPRSRRTWRRPASTTGGSVGWKGTWVLASSSAADASRPAIVALIPGYNEGPRIGAVVRGALEHLPVLVVDDGSTDDTADAARGAGATVIGQRPNQGKGAALRAGFRRALDEGADAVVTLDADGQHDPAEIPAFLAACARVEPPPELVVGRRNFRAMPPIRRLSNVARRLGVLVGGRPADRPTTSPATG